jgi:FkbH-like protein
MMTLFARARASLLHRNGLSVGELAEKVVANGTALVSAPFLLRRCDRVGVRARTRGKPIIENLGRIEIGDDFQANCAFVPVRLHCGNGATLSIGDAVNVNFGAEISAERSVTIGSRVSLGPHVAIADHDYDQPAGEAAPVVIGDGVWLAARVRVKKGVTIGEDTVVTAGSVVETSLPPGVVAGGTPARVLRTRRPTGVIATTAPVVAVKRLPDTRGIVVADFTANDLALALERDDVLGPTIEAEIAPFDQVVQTLHALAQPNQHTKDFAFVWTRPDRVSAAFARLLDGNATQADILAEVDVFVDRILAVRGASYVFVATWTMPPYSRGHGMLDMRSGGVSRSINAMNLRLAERLEQSPNVFVLDAARWMTGKSPYSSRLWYMSKVGFANDVFDNAAHDLRAALRGVRGEARKLLVLDLDDTMWGGIVGDVGWQNLRLGGHDPVGEALVEFQRAVVALSRRGVALAIVSKNEESVALEAIRCHPEMVVTPEHFAGWRINWRDKAQNISELAAELNLGLQSIVFIDDNPIERARVREALPQVFVPDWPEDKTQYVEAFQSLRCFDVPSISREDAERTKMYAQERVRHQLQSAVPSLDEWLDGLGTIVRFAPLSASNLPRTTQLLNKTNQMNLRTRRMSEPELMEWSCAKGRELWSVTVSDKLGDAGLTGIVGIETERAVATVTDYVLSCRVMGRRVEETILWFAVERARKHGASELRAPYAATSKNKPCLSLFEAQESFARVGDMFVWNGEKPYPRPRNIEVVVEGAA